MFHFIKDFPSAKWQVKREHIHNKINMPSIKKSQEYYNSQEAYFKTWDRCVLLMSHCIQHPISQNTELLMINCEWCITWCFHPDKVQVSFVLKARWGACLLLFYICIFYIWFQLWEYLQGKKTPKQDFHKGVYYRSTVEDP